MAIIYHSKNKSIVKRKKPLLHGALLTGLLFTIASASGFWGAGPGHGRGAAVGLSADGWSFKREIVIGYQGERVADAVIQIQFSDKDFDYKKARADGADIRFSTGSGELHGPGLPYWTEQWNQDGLTRIWVRLPVLGPKLPNRIVMYYGNASAPAVSDGNATFLFFDDFEGGHYAEKWNNISIGEVAEQDGLLKLRESDGEDGIIRADFSVTGQMIVRTLYQRGGADQHWTRAGVGGWNKYLCFGDHTDFAGTGTNYVMLYDSSSIGNLKTAPLIKAANKVITDKWRRAAYWYDGQNLNGMQDDVVVRWPIAEGASSKLSLRTLDNDNWDNFAYVTVSAYIGPEPAVVMGQEQMAAQDTGDQSSPKVLPGKGLRQFDFFYAGEAKSRNMYIVRNGKITWSYIDTVGKGEISDAVLMSNGNVLFAHQFGVTLIDRDKKVIWNYDAPAGYETHTAQPIGKDHVVFVQNGNPAKVFVMNIRTNTVEKEFPLPFKSGTHGQIRHARLTAAGTLLVAHMDLGKVCEYDINGKELLSLDVPAVWSAVPLKNGNWLVTSNQKFVREITREGKIVWDCPLGELPGYKISPQLSQRLPNGNTLINSWFNQWDGKSTDARHTVQAIEVTPAKKIVWALRSWEAPADLGPATTFQLLNDPDNIYEKAYFGDIR